MPLKLPVGVVFVIGLVPMALATPEMVVVVGEEPAPVRFALTPGTPYKLNYPDTKIRLWTNPMQIAGTEIPPGVARTAGQNVFGDANGDGRVQLDDLITIRNDLGTSTSTSDVDGSGWVNDVDLVLCRNMLNTGGDVLTVHVEGLEPSTALDDVTIELLTDPDTDGNFTVASTQVLTVLRITFSSEEGLIGSAVTVTLEPAIAPLAFDSTTTAIWNGALYPDLYYLGYYLPPTQLITVRYDSSQLHEDSASAARFVIGDGHNLNEAVGQVPLWGWIYGDITFSFGTLSVKTTFLYYVDAIYGFAAGGPSGVGGPVPFLRLIDPTRWPDISLEYCTASQYVAVILVDKNELSLQIAPPMLPADIVTFDLDGNEVDRATVWMIRSDRDDYYSDTIVYYSYWEEPLMFVTSRPEGQSYPGLTLLVADSSGGFVDIQLK